MWSILRQKAGVVPTALNFVYQTTFKMIVTVFGIVLVIATVDAIWADHIVIEPLSVPRKLEDDGYSGAIVSQRLLREVRTIVESSDTLLREPTGDGGAARRVTFRNEEALATLAAIQVPSSGLSLRSVSAMLCNFFGHPERKITGEITIKRPAGATEPAVYSIVLQLPTATSLSVEHADIDEAISLSAELIAQQYNPLGLAAFYYKEEKKKWWEQEKGQREEAYRKKWEKERREKWDKVDQIADALIESKGSDLRKEGLFLRGIFLRQINDRSDAVYFFEQAIKENRTFSDAYNGWGAALVDDGRIPEALEIYQKAI